VPEPYLNYSGSNVLVMEYMEGLRGLESSVSGLSAPR
jgi:predicted unusual protein kinase regulating ubiquinone biosynthesis (AarF/ABC1/UbiB family)